MGNSHSLGGGWSRRVEWAVEDPPNAAVLRLVPCRVTRRVFLEPSERWRVGSLHPPTRRRPRRLLSRGHRPPPHSRSGLE